jgi:hypothetical protein
MIEFKQGQDPYKAMGLGFPSCLKVRDRIQCIENIERGFKQTWKKIEEGSQGSVDNPLTKNTIYIINAIPGIHFYGKQYDFGINEDDPGQLTRVHYINKDVLTRYFRKV